MNLSDLKPRNISHRLLSGVAPLFGAFPINDIVTRSISPIMIVGCGRSGNTLLRGMLVHGGQVAIPPESYVWSSVARGFARWRYRTWTDAADRVIDAFRGADFGFSPVDFDTMKADAAALPSQRRSLGSLLDLIYRTYCNLNGFGGRRWGDKTPLNILDIKVIEDIFPAAQYVHIIRDPRAVSLSIMNAAKTSSGIREKSFAEAADRWNKSIRNGLALSDRVGAKRYAEVRYEELLANPSFELQRLCKFLGIAYNPDMLSFHEGARQLGDVSRITHLKRVGQPLKLDRSHAWERSISTTDRQIVDNSTMRYRQLLGYL